MGKREEREGEGESRGGGAGCRVGNGAAAAQTNFTVVNNFDSRVAPTHSTHTPRWPVKERHPPLMTAFPLPPLACACWAHWQLLFGFGCARRPRYAYGYVSVYSLHSSVHSLSFTLQLIQFFMLHCVGFAAAAAAVASSSSSTTGQGSEFRQQFVCINSGLPPPSSKNNICMAYLMQF